MFGTLELSKLHFRYRCPWTQLLLEAFTYEAWYESGDSIPPAHVLKPLGRLFRQFDYYYMLTWKS
jgi:hypothetical protein